MKMYRRFSNVNNSKNPLLIACTIFTHCNGNVAEDKKLIIQSL